jgi:hypothetical protein
MSRTSITMWSLLVWAYQRQKVHLAAHDASRGAASISPTAAVLERLRIGVSVDVSPSGRGGGGAVWGSTGDADALIVHELMLRLGRHAWGLIEAASIGAVPEWRPHIPEPKVRPVLRGNGKPKMRYQNNRPIACLVHIEGFTPQRAADEIRYARRRYTEWWVALSLLHEVLSEEQPLLKWHVLGIGAPAEPWRNEKAIDVLRKSLQR